MHDKYYKTRLEHVRTFEGLITRIYHQQLSNSKRRKFKSMPDYTKEEFVEWFKSQPYSEYLFKSWVESGYNTELSPSCDRLDDYKPYSFDNIRLVTWKENRNKVYADKKNGINNKESKAVLQYDMSGNFIKEYYSISEAGRQTGIHFTSISKVCGGIRNHAENYKFKYKK